MTNKSITGPVGFRAAAVRAGIKESGKADVGLIVADEICSAAAVFTKNKVVGPAVEISRKHLGNGRGQAVFVNAGNANTCTGKRGEKDAETICKVVAAETGVAAEDVAVCSTGIIGHYLPMEKVKAGIKTAAKRLAKTSKAGGELARAILTTDTKVKTAHRQIRLDQKVVQVAGIAKGSGMIAPNMATMLGFIATDAAISSALLRRGLKEAAEVTFNKVSVDNHMSTSDTVIVLAGGGAGNKKISKVGGDFKKFAEALRGVCDDLARQIAADGEGARCAIKVSVNGAATAGQAQKAVRAIVDSPLVRTAFNGADPNWGRIISAVGYSGAKFKSEGLTCKIAGTMVYRKGRPCAFDARQLHRKMRGKSWEVEVDLAAGKYSDFCYTCDLSREYVHINADYHT